MSINARVKLVRKKKKYTQEEFGKILNLGQAGVSWIEQEGNKVTEEHIKRICEKFSVDDYWLRTGKGMMEIDHTVDLVDRLAHELKLTEKEKNILLAYTSFPEEERAEMMESAGNIMQRYYAITYGGLDLSHRSDDIEIEKKVAEYRLKLEAEREEELIKSKRTFTASEKRKMLAEQDNNKIEK